MTIKYHVRLSAEERSMLEALVKQEKPRVAQHKKRKANILLAIDEDHAPLQHDQVAKAFHIKPVTITRLRQRFVEEGLDAAVNGKLSHHGRQRKLDGEVEAHLVALVCSPPPEGASRWTLNLLKDRMIELEYIESIGRSTIHEGLKKLNLSLGKKRNGVFPSKKALSL